MSKLENAEQQYLHALFTPSEDAWKAVAEYFPDEITENRLWTRRARRRLGEYYLNRGETDKALATYQGLSSLEETAQGFRLAGLVGEAIVYDRWNNREEVVERLERIPAQKRVLLLDNFLLEEFDRLTVKYAGENK
ncbi:MAG: hypothetical protein IAF94_01410 [Pirellulaceae bacterium]|nr:hypothetical protein [Pirellulaceae bacterium]